MGFWGGYLVLTKTRGITKYQPKCFSKETVSCSSGDSLLVKLRLGSKACYLVTA